MLSFNDRTLMNTYIMPEDLPLLKRIVSIFEKSFPVDYSKILKAINDKNSEDLDFLLHKLNGSFGVVFCESGLNVLAQMKNMMFDFKSLELFAPELDIEFKLLMRDLNRFIVMIETSNTYIVVLNADYKRN